MRRIVKDNRYYGSENIVVFDKYYRPVYEGDFILTKYGRVCEVVWLRSDNHIGYDLKPTGYIDYPPPDEYDMWYGGNLIKVTNCGYDEIEKIREAEGLKKYGKDDN